MIDRIKFDGLASKDWLIYKFPGEDFTVFSRLIVGEGQVALFVKGGVVGDVFQPGSYNLDTPNIPILSNILNIPYGGKTPFTAEVYFINYTTKLDVKWGTVNPIPVIDPKYNIKLNVRAFGQMGLKIDNYSRFFTELVGAMAPRDIVSYKKVYDWFKGLIGLKIKSIIADCIINKKISVLEISAKLDEISDHAKEKISDQFQAYGLKVVNFYIESINFPDEDFERINVLLGNRAEFDIMGDSRYVTKRSFDVMEDAAENEGSGGAFLSGGFGLGLGQSMAGSITGKSGIASALNPYASLNTESKQCPRCNAAMPFHAAYCSSCGSKLKEKITCPACHAENPEHAVFCHGCGTKLQKGFTCHQCSAELEESAKFCSSCGVGVLNEKICPSCGDKNPAGSKFCDNCGNSLGGRLQ